MIRAIRVLFGTPVMFLGICLVAFGSWMLGQDGFKLVSDAWEKSRG